MKKLQIRTADTNPALNQLSQMFSGGVLDMSSTYTKD
jgi:hypothetical protein